MTQDPDATGAHIAHPTRPDQPGSVAVQARAVIADYDRVRTWSDQPARQRELARLGALAIDLLRAGPAATPQARRP
jgi:hypothetical protein